MNSIPSVDAIKERFAEGSLLEWACQRFGGLDLPQLKETANTCAEVHNGSQIDLLSLMSEEALEPIEQRRFFDVMPFFCEVIPQLSSDLPALMNAVRVLVRKAGNDGVAHLPNAAFREWCKVNPSKAARIIELAKIGDATAEAFLSFALEALSDAEEATGFVASGSHSACLSGMTSLGRMELPDETAAKQALSGIRDRLAGETEDDLQACGLLSTLAIAENFPSIASDNVGAIVQRSTRLSAQR